MNSSIKPKPVVDLSVAPCCGSAHEHRPAPLIDACCSVRQAASEPTAPPPDANQARYRIDQMDCPTEEGLIRTRLKSMAGVAHLDFKLLDRELTVYHHLDDPQPITQALESLDMGACLLEAGAPAVALPPALSARTKTLLAVSGLAALAAEIVAWTSGNETGWPVLALAALSLLSAGLPTLKKGWIALKNLTLNIYFLMSLAVAGAFAIGKWPEAAMVVFLFALAEAIEALSLERARQAIKALTALAPDSAEVQTANGW